MDTQTTKAMLLCAAQAIIDNEPLLTDADRALGDGDHGLGMKRGMEAAKAELESSDLETPSDAFKTMGSAMMSSMGGASGAIFGTVFRSGAKALKGKDALDSAGVANFLRTASDAVMKRGGAKPGDKTMIDALEPAALKGAEVSGQSLVEALAAVAAAAEDGREASKAMIATMGRAKTLGEQSVGHPDAGACSMAIILRAMSDFATSHASA